MIPVVVVIPARRRVVQVVVVVAAVVILAPKPVSRLRQAASQVGFVRVL